MRNFVLLLLLLSAPAFAAPEFKTPTQPEYRAAYLQITEVFTKRRDALGMDGAGQYIATKKDNLVVFAVMLAEAWNTAHVKPTTKTLNELWEMPQANDWLGCLFVQFPDLEKNVDAANFATYVETPALFVWLVKNKDTAPPDFIARLNKLEEWAPRCEAIVRADDDKAI